MTLRTLFFLGFLFSISITLHTLTRAETVTWHHCNTPSHTECLSSDVDIHNKQLVNNSEKLLISIAEQQLYHVDCYDKIIKKYPISSGLRGTGEQIRSYKTPRGWLQVISKHGYNNSTEQHYRARIPCKQRTGITSRILTLQGLQSHNGNSMQRCIYIHGTTAVHSLGKTAKSEGCIRMHPKDIQELFDVVEPGTAVYVFDNKNPLPWQNAAQNNYSM